MGTGHQTEIATSTKHQLKTTAVSETILTSLEANTQSIFQDSPRTTEVRFLEIKTLMHTWVQPHIQISHHQPKILHWFNKKQYKSPEIPSMKINQTVFK